MGVEVNRFNVLYTYSYIILIKFKLFEGFV